MLGSSETFVKITTRTTCGAEYSGKRERTRDQYLTLNQHRLIFQSNFPLQKIESYKNALRGVEVIAY